MLGRFNHGKGMPGGVHAPSAYPDPNNQGELINIFNINSGIPAVNWNQIMSIPHHYALNNDKTLNIQAGAGIVYDSVPRNEWDETMNKGRAIFKAVSMAEAGLEGDYKS